ncbi:MAG: hypothetical protein ABR986_01650 [Methanomassiliicoccales archaeon]
MAKNVITWQGDDLTCRAWAIKDLNLRKGTFLITSPKGKCRYGELKHLTLPDVLDRSGISEHEAYIDTDNGAVLLPRQS